MSRSIFQPEWRTQSRRKRRFYARYMGWLERSGFVIVTLLLVGFIGSFFYEVDEWVTADEVPLEAESVTVARPAGIHTIVMLVQNGDSVAKGQTIVELRSDDPQSQLRKTIEAPIDGVIEYGSEEGTPELPEGALAVIRDYGHLVVRPKLGGKSVSTAGLGQVAELTNLRIQAPGETLLKVEAEGRTSVSRRLAGLAVKQALDESLKGRSIQVRDDVPLKISEIGEVEIETGVRVQPDSGPGLAFDPDPDFSVRGKVVSGRHVLSAQIGELPQDVRQRATEALLRQLRGKPLDLGGKGARVEDVIDPRYVVKVTAEGSGDAGEPLAGASLKRTFEATIRLEGVSSDLVKRVQEAHREGKQVTARVQVRTGSRPIAYFLLRRS